MLLSEYSGPLTFHGIKDDHMRQIASCYFFALASALYFTGCTHLQLQHNAVKQSNSLTTIYQKQVIDNLAMFVHDPYSVPSFAIPNAGQSIVIDGGSVTVGSGAFTGRFWKFIGVGGSRQMQEAWTLAPVTDPDKLRLMRCAYQRAIGVPCEPCVDCCSIEKGFYGAGNKQIKVAKVGTSAANSTLVNPQPIDPLTGLPFASEPIIEVPDSLNPTTPTWEPTLNIDPRTGQKYSYNWITGEVSIPSYDCNSPCAIHAKWFCHSNSWRDVPKECRNLYGYHKGTYVWVPSNYHHEFAKLVLKIMDFALTSAPPKPTKSVVVYLDENGGQTTKGKHTKEAVGNVSINASEEDIRKAFGIKLNDPRFRDHVSAREELRGHIESAKTNETRSDGIKAIRSFALSNGHYAPFNELKVTDSMDDAEILQAAEDVLRNIGSSPEPESAGTFQELTTFPQQSSQLNQPNIFMLQQGLNAITPGGNARPIQP